MADLSKLVILEESVILNLAANPNFVQEFPFLSSMLNNIPTGGTTGSGCSRCNRTAARRINAINGVKQSFLSMGAEKKQRLKQLLNTEKIRLRLVAGGKVMEYTF
jgi:hypothetical protein